MSEENQNLTSSVNFILDNYRYEDRDRLAEFLRDNGHKLEMLKSLVARYKDYFGADAVLKLRVRPHGEDRNPKRSLLVHIYTNNLEEEEGGRPVIDRFIDECVKNKSVTVDESPEEEADRILFQAKPMSQVDEVFSTYEKTQG